MARGGNKCRCCPCNIVTMFRCNHLSPEPSKTFEFWNTGSLPLLSCDALPRAREIRPKGPWSQVAASGSIVPLAYAGGGAFAVDVRPLRATVTATLEHLGSRASGVSIATNVTKYESGGSITGSERVQSLAVSLFGGDALAALTTELIEEDIEKNVLKILDAGQFLLPGTSYPRPGLVDVVLFGGRCTAMEYTVEESSEPAFSSFDFAKAYELFYSDNGTQADVDEYRLEWFESLATRVYHPKRIVSLNGESRLAQTLVQNGRDQQSLTVLAAEDAADASIHLVTAAVDHPAPIVPSFPIGRTNTILYSVQQETEEKRVQRQEGYTAEPIRGLRGKTGCVTHVYQDGKFVTTVSKTAGVGYRIGDDNNAGVIGAPAVVTLQGTGSLVTKTLPLYYPGNSATVHYTLTETFVPAGGGDPQIQTRVGRERISGSTTYTVSFGGNSLSSAEYSIFLAPSEDEFCGPFEALTEEEGSYFFISEYDASCPYASDAAIPFVDKPGPRSIDPGDLTVFHSVVIDTTPPVGAVQQVDDFFVDDPLGEYPPRYSSGISSPLSNVGCGLQQFFSEPINRSQQSMFIQAGLSAGSYSLSPNYGSQPIRDRAGNVLAVPPSVSFVVHPIPEDRRLGAMCRATLPHNAEVKIACSYVDQFSRTADFPAKSLAYGLPVTRVRITFDKRVRLPIDQSGTIDTALASLSGKGVDGAIGGNIIAIERVGTSRTEYDVVIDGGVQDENTQWTLVFTPTSSVVVIPDDMEDLRFQSRNTFPEVGELGAIYTDAATKLEYAFSSGLYSLLNNGELPSDDAPEQCRLACRAQWVIRQGNSPQRELIDTLAAVPVEIGGVPSVSALVATPTTAAKLDELYVGVGSDLFLPPSGGSFSTESRSRFVPGVPATQDSAVDDFSYFGLPFTIYPSPPKTLAACAVPSGPQRHSSIIMDGGLEITALSLQLVPAQVRGTVAENLYPGYDAAAPENGFPPGIVYDLTGGEFDSEDEMIEGFGPEIALCLTTKPMALASQLAGTTTSQNVWSYVGTGDETYDIGRVGFPGDDTTFEFFTIGTVQTRRVQANLVARRNCIPYPALQTAVLGSLRLDLFVRAVVEITFNEGAGVSGRRAGVQHRELDLTHSIHVSRSQELALADGQQITCPVEAFFGVARLKTNPSEIAVTSHKYVWKIQRA